MKTKLFTRLFAVALVVCMLVPQTAFAANKYNLKLTVAPAGAAAVTLTSGNVSQTDANVLTEVIQMVNADLNKNDKSQLKKIGTPALAAKWAECKAAAEADWAAFVAQEEQNITGVDDISATATIELLKNKNTTTGELVVDTNYKLEYALDNTKYTVTLRLDKGDIGGGDIGGGGFVPGPIEPPVEPEPEVPPVKPEEGSTVVKPDAQIKGDTVNSEISSAAGKDMVNQAAKDKSDKIVIAPEVAPQDAQNLTKTEVSIPADTVRDINTKTEAALVVNTPVANVTIPNTGLADLATGEKVKIAAEVKGDEVTLNITAGNKEVSKIKSGVTLSVPKKDAPSGMVAVLVKADGTRQVIKKSIAVDGNLMIPLDGSAKLELKDTSVKFKDVKENQWFENAVDFTSARTLFNGTGHNEFSPAKDMTRGMVAVVLHNLEYNPESHYTGSFPDVQDGAWYADGVKWAAEQGIVNGYGDGKYGAGDSISREQLACMLWKYAGKPTAEKTDLKGEFSDASSISGYARDAMAWANEIGVVNGKGAGKLDPKGQASRAEVAQMLMNFVATLY